MMVNERAQEQLERLWMAEEDGQAGIPKTEHPVGSVQDLLDGKWIVQDQGFWKLTASGREEAACAIRRHRLGEVLLADVLRGDQNQVDDQACRLEHVLFDGLDESICTLLGHPGFCPHGKAIPPGDCCREKRARAEAEIAPLIELQPGQAGQVVFIQMGNPGRLEKLMAMGILPGGSIKLLRSSPSFVFESGYSQFAVDEVIASGIYVRRDAVSS
jgi:DtxR family Mn-dependent transcriptional regulator